MFAKDTTVVSFPELGWGPWEMDRYLVRDLFGKVSVAWYGVIICLGIILACLIALRNAKRREGMNPDSFADYFLAAIPASIVGARLMYVLTNLDVYDSFLEAISIWKGGLAVYGGVITGFAAVFVTAHFKKDSPVRVLDAVAPALLFAQALGRWGNFVNGEAYGYETSLPWGMSVNGSLPVHPTFLYESLITFSGFLILTFLIYPRKKYVGQNVVFYMIWYGVGRALVEGLRSDSLWVGPFRISQIIGIVSAVAGVVLAFLLPARAKRILLKEGEAGEAETAADEAEKDEAPETETETETEIETETETAPSEEASPEDAPAETPTEETKPEGDEHGTTN